MSSASSEARQHTAHAHTEVKRVERRAQVDEERIVHRTGKYAHIVRQVANPLVEQRLVVGHRARSDVGRHCVQSLAFAEERRLAALNHGDGVGLPQTEALGTRTRQRSDRRNTGNAAHQTGEQSWLANFRGEAELESDVFDSVLIVIDLHFIEHVGIEGKIVWPVGRFEKRIDVKDHGDAVRMVVTDEGVPVGYVRGAIERCDGSLAMAGRKQVGRSQHEQRHDEGHH